MTKSFVAQKCCKMLCQTFMLCIRVNITGCFILCYQTNIADLQSILLGVIAKSISENVFICYSQYTYNYQLICSTVHLLLSVVIIIANIT